MGLGDTTRDVLVRFVTEDVNSGAVASSMKSHLAGVAVVAAGAAAAIKFVGDETMRLDNIAKGFDKSGLAVDTYQQLSHVAKLAGSDITNVAKATVKLASNMLELERGAGVPVAEALAKINLEMSDLAGKSDTDRLGILADALSEVESDSERAALSVQLMGKSGRDLLPLFRLGKQGIDEAIGSVGKIFTREDLAKAELYQDQLTEMRKVASDIAGELAIELAPALGKMADGVAEAGKGAGDALPAVSAVLKNMAKEFETPLKLIGLLGAVIGSLGRTAEFFAGKMDRAADATAVFLDDVEDWISESAVADWARGAADALGVFDETIDETTESAEEQGPVVRELSKQWDELTGAITGSDDALSDLSAFDAIPDGIQALLDAGRVFAAQQEEAAAKSLDTASGINMEADATQRLAELMRASGDSQENVNALLRDALVLRRDAAVLAEDELKTIEAAHKLAVFDATVAAEAAKPTGGGRRGPSRADRVRAAGGGAVQDLEHMATLQASIAGSAQEIFDAEEASRAARLAALDLEREALTVTKARGQVARDELQMAKDAVDQEAGLIVLEGREAARKREVEATKDLQTIEIARNAARAEEEGRVISLETFRLDSMAKQLEAQGQLSAAASVRQQMRQQEADFAAQEFAAREEELALRPPEGELEAIEQKGALQQLEHDREIARIEQDGAARAAHDSELDRLAKAEAKRKKAAMAQTKAIAGATRSVMSQGQAFAGRVLDAAGVDGEKRAKIDQQIGAVSAFVTGAISTVKGVAAAASSNPVSAAAHFASAAFAIGTGVAMLAGNVQGAAGGGSAAAPGPEPRAERETSEAARIPDSVPAADREPSQRFGADPRGGSGGTVVNIGSITANGAIDDEFAENMATALDNQQFKRGA